MKCVCEAHIHITENYNCAERKLGKEKVNGSPYM